MEQLKRRPNKKLEDMTVDEMKEGIRQLEIIRRDVLNAIKNRHPDGVEIDEPFNGQR